MGKIIETNRFKNTVEMKEQRESLKHLVYKLRKSCVSHYFKNVRILHYGRSLHFSSGFVYATAKKVCISAAQLSAKL